MKALRNTAILIALLLTSAGARAQFDLGSLLGLGQSQTGDVISGLTSIFSKDKVASESGIIGTWQYEEPAIVFESDNFLSRAGGKIASEKIEKTLRQKFEKYGVKAGSFVITFNKDSTFAEKIGKQNLKGTWHVADGVLKLTYPTTRTMQITTQMEGGKLMFVTDATKLLDLVKNMTAKASTTQLKTVQALLKGFKGVKAGLTLVKK